MKARTEIFIAKLRCGIQDLDIKEYIQKFAIVGQ